MSNGFEINNVNSCRNYFLVKTSFYLLSVAYLGRQITFIWLTLLITHQLTSNNYVEIVYETLGFKLCILFIVCFDFCINNLGESSPNKGKQNMSEARIKLSISFELESIKN